MAAHATICRHEADDAAGAARRAAGDVLWIPGIATLWIILIVAMRSHGELDHDEAAEVDGTGPVEPAERRGGVGRPPVGAQLRSAGRHPAGPVVHVLVRQRHTVER